MERKIMTAKEIGETMKIVVEKIQKSCDHIKKAHELQILCRDQAMEAARRLGVNGS